MTTHSFLNMNFKVLDCKLMCKFEYWILLSRWILIEFLIYANVSPWLIKMSSPFPDWYGCNIWRIHFLPLLLNLKFTISQWSFLSSRKWCDLEFYKYLVDNKLINLSVIQKNWIDWFGDFVWVNSFAPTKDSY